jgi:hypothetical protein
MMMIVVIVERRSGRTIANRRRMRRRWFLIGPFYFGNVIDIRWERYGSFGQ